MNIDTAYALPLFSLIDEAKVDPSQPLPQSLAETLQGYLESQFGIRSLSAKFHLLGSDPYLVLFAVPSESLPALCSLVDVQKTQLYRYEREDDETVSLTPLWVKV